MIKTTSFILLSLFFIACNRKAKYPYAIRDFNPSLQKYLTDFVAKGGSDWGDSSYGYIRDHATVVELKKLTISEHPLLRVAALNILINKEEPDQSELIISHLDDTAIYVGNTGFSYVSDGMIFGAQWKSREERMPVIDSVILNHNYLRSAYLILDRIKKKPEYYSAIKIMATRDNKDFNDIQYAISALSDYGKQEDIRLIKNILQNNYWRLGYVSFNMIRDHPDTAYLPMLESYILNNSIYADLYKATRNADYSVVESYFEALASYENDRSAKALNYILTQKRFLDYNSHDSNIKEKLDYTIWSHDCDAYSNLRKLIKPDIERSKKALAAMPAIDPIEVEKIDLGPPRISWWSD